MKAIIIHKCYEECPHCTGPDFDGKKWYFTCQEVSRWIDDEDKIPEWCPLPDFQKPPASI
jgi:hypothetical protein